MLRTMTLAFLVIALMLAAVPGGASALTVANISQKGSLLIFPKIVTVACPESGTSATPVVDTVVYLSNDFSKAVNLKCYWIFEDRSFEEFSFTLSANQPVAFSACQNEHGPPFGSNASGQLLCWAMDAGETKQISHNHLYGNALIQYTPPAESPPIPVPSAVSYNAWAYQALKNPPGTPGEIKLDGIDYDASPASLVTGYVPGESADTWGRPVEAELALALCRQDLRSERTPACTKAAFSLWSAAPTELTGACQCVNTWYAGLLKEFDSPGGFVGGSPAITKSVSYPARFKVTPEEPDPGDTKCEATCAGADAAKVPFVGVLLYESIFDGVPYRIPYAALALEGVDADPSGHIRYDVSSGPIE